MNRNGVGQGRKGFTLIELLVVIAIIAILAGILLPVFAQARAKARQIACLSNIKQLSLALDMYTEDWNAYPMHDNPIPGQTMTGTNAILAVTWMDALYSYVKNSGIFYCPAAGFQNPLDSTTQSIGYNWQYLGNGALAFFGVGTTVADSAIQDPTDTLAFADSDGIAGATTQGFDGFVIDPPKPSPNWAALGPKYYGWGDYYVSGHAAQVSTRHTNGANVGFLDGHAKWYRTDTILRDNSMWNGRNDPLP